MKERAAFELVKEWLLPENQIAYAKAAGLCAREDLFPKIMGAPDRYGEVGTAMLKNAGVWSNHPRTARGRCRAPRWPTSSKRTPRK